ncbi:hypothetical protein [Paenibacillus roseipurpureus]|uniref:Uncharacterized protein n=1 Tax=Paenibacillus roseopurpureus TaxID=2918901 RepID=A0AA96RK03_9BACL|nr:hypothetical protein [Paenibacillus sp. MBLB1832]WNR44330.1 hypothetical protein MJB10_25255 [Paenibacillus sp. MBLB1832]
MMPSPRTTYNAISLSYVQVISLDRVIAFIEINGCKAVSDA